MYSRLILAGLLAATLSSKAFGQDALLTPNWSDPAAQAYLTEKKTPNGLSDNITSFNAPLSLPALGLRSNFTTSKASPTNGFIEPGEERGIKWWPSCASALDTAPQTAAAPNGTWYSVVYDFKCITITIVGDRNNNSQVPGSLQDELSESKGDAASMTDEANESGATGDTLSINYDIIRFNIPYAITIECNTESQSFCKDNKAQKNLLARLSIVSGDAK